MDVADRLKAHYAGQVFEYGYASLCRMTVPDDLTGKRVLDIGCRRGKGVFKLSDRVGANGHAIGLDWHEPYIAEATEKAERAWHDNGLAASNMSFVVGYPEDLAAAGIEDASIDYVFVNSVLHLTYAPTQVLAELARVLKPGGTLTCEVALADVERNPRVIAAARNLGNSIQAAPYKAAFEQRLAAVGFGEPRYKRWEEVDPATGYKLDHKVEIAPSEEDVRFYSSVVLVQKL